MTDRAWRRRFRLNRDGLTNDVVVLNDAIVARFARGEWARAALVHERAILDQVRRYVQVQVSVLQVEQLHDDVMIYGFIPGAP